MKEDGRVVLSIDTKIVRSSVIISSEMDDETVMMSIEKGAYYGLNAVGSRIWELIETPQRVSDICCTLCKEFKVTPEKCQNSVLRFLNALQENQIITIADG